MTSPGEVIRYFLLIRSCTAASEYVPADDRPPAAGRAGLLVSVAGKAATHHEIEVLLASRAHAFPAVLRAIVANPAASEIEKSDAQQLLKNHEPSPAPATDDDDILATLEILTQYQREHAEEIAAEADKQVPVDQGAPRTKRTRSRSCSRSIDVPAASKQAPAVQEVAKEARGARARFGLCRRLRECPWASACNWP
jgi:hypothetical protein